MTAIAKIGFDQRLDVVPVAYARPIISPPHASQVPDAALFAYRCPHTGEIRMIEENITIWPFVVTCEQEGAAKGLPTVLRLGSAIFVGLHLFKPSARERLIGVLGKVYEGDRNFGAMSRWVETRAVINKWEPMPRAESMLFSSLRGTTAKPKAKAPIAPIDTPPSAA